MATPPFTPPFTPISQPQPQQQKGWQQLAALIPIALAKGGRDAVAGLLAGYQQALYRQQQMGMDQQQLDFQRERMLAQDDRAFADDRRADQHLKLQQDQFAATQKERERRTFLEQAQALGAIDQSPEAAMTALSQMTPQASALGIPQAMVEQQFAVTPSGAEKRRLQKILTTVDTEYKTLDPASRDNLKPVDGGGRTVGEIRAALAGVQSAPVQEPKGAPAVGSFEDYVTAKFGPRPTPAQIAQARKEYYNQADDRPTGGGTGGDARTNARIDRIVGTFNSHPIVKEYNEVQSQHAIIKGIIESQWSGPGDMGAVFAFMKALDPNSVVRETEYANAAASGNIFQGWAARFNGALNPNGGFLSDRVKRDFLRTIETRLGYKSQQYQNLRKQLVDRVDRIRSGAPETGDEALVNYEVAPTGPAATPQPGSAYERYKARQGAK